MVSVEQLQERVSERYNARALQSWPPPRPRGASPREEEYSRLTDPGRSRIVHERARDWTAVLGSLPGVRVDTLRTSDPPSAGPYSYQRGVRITPPHADALPLLLLEHDVASDAVSEPLAVLSVAVVRPDIVVTRQPDCGCDACDSGSADLLQAVDEPICQIVGGPFVALRGDSWHAEWHPEGFRAGGTGSEAHPPPAHQDFETLREQCRRLAAGDDVRLPDGAEVFVGRSWLP